MTEAEIIEEIRFCMGEKVRLSRRIGFMKDTPAFAEMGIGMHSIAIKVLEDRLWWLRFIDYCNTPCWRFKC